MAEAGEDGEDGGAGGGRASQQGQMRPSSQLSGPYHQPSVQS